MTYRNTVCCFLLLTMLAFPFCFATDGLSLEVRDGAGTRITASLQEIEGRYYLSRRTLFELFDKRGDAYHTEWDGRNGILRITKGKDVFSFFTKGKKFVASGEYLDCVEAVRIMQGEVLFPLSSFDLLNQRLGEFRIVEKPKDEIALTVEAITEEEMSASVSHLHPSGLSVQPGDDLAEQVRPFALPSDDQGLRKIEMVVLDPALPQMGKEPGSARIDAVRLFSFEVARLIKRTLDVEGSLKTAITCTPEETLTVEERVNRINGSGAQLALVVRVGRSEFPSVGGIFLYCTNEVVDFEGATSRIDPYHPDEPSPVWLNYLTYQYESLVYAYPMAQALKRALTLDVHDIKTAPVYLLKRASMPAVMVELGYYTNEKDLEVLSLEWTKHAVARALAGSVLGYKRFVDSRLAKKEQELLGAGSATNP